MMAVTVSPLLQQMEADLAEWYKGQDIFFDKTHPEHADRPKKFRIFSEKAAELNIFPGDLTRWLAGQRHRVNAIYFART